MNGFQKFLRMVDGHEKTEPKKLLKSNISLFMLVNHAKEFLKSVHNEALFSHLFSRTLIEVRSVNFKAKFLKMAKINSEFLNVSMVEPAPESATTLVSLMQPSHSI